MKRRASLSPEAKPRKKIICRQNSDPVDFAESYARRQIHQPYYTEISTSLRRYNRFQTMEHVTNFVVQTSSVVFAEENLRLIFDDLISKAFQNDPRPVDLFQVMIYSQGLKDPVVIPPG